MPLFDDEAHHAAAGMAVLGFEAVRFDREFRDCLDRRRVHGNPRSGQSARRIGRNAIEVGAIAGRLSAAQRKVVVPEILCFRRQRRQVKRAAQRAAHHQRQFVYELVRDCGSRFRIFGLQGGGLGLNFNHLLGGADFQGDIAAGIQARIDNYVIQDGRFESLTLDSYGVGADPEVRSGTKSPDSVLTVVSIVFVEGS